MKFAAIFLSAFFGIVFLVILGFVLLSRIGHQFQDLTGAEVLQAQPPPRNLEHIPVEEEHLHNELNARLEAMEARVSYMSKWIAGVLVVLVGVFITLAILIFVTLRSLERHVAQLEDLPAQFDEIFKRSDERFDHLMAVMDEKFKRREKRSDERFDHLMAVMDEKFKRSDERLDNLVTRPSQQKNWTGS
jgi:predicted PurR-regulated permease PerM